MAGNDSPGDNSKDVQGPQDPLVQRRRPDPVAPPVAGKTLTGFLGDSDRAGHRRLYLTTSLDYYAEFAIEDVLDTTHVVAEQPPFIGEDATRIVLKQDATVAYTRTRTTPPPDIFDLDIQRMTSPGPPVHGSYSLPGTTCNTCRVTCTTCFSCVPSCPVTCSTCWDCPTMVVDVCTATCPWSEPDNPHCGPSQIEGACG
ncbi:MAG: hypothetical protein QOH34_4689 [Mycobacterium sp.]|jgi:hypothetical protein|nr:hypothetical protein [Mycobacterium sp.]